MENETKDSLASELLHELKASSKRWFILFIITLFMLFATNSMWLYAWNLPPEETSESYDIDSEDNGNAVYNNSGEVDINGKD